MFRYQLLSHALWARQQQQRAQIDEEITRVLKPPQSTVPAASGPHLAPPASLLAPPPGSMKPLVPRNDAGGGGEGAKVKVRVMVTRFKDGEAAGDAAPAAMR